MPPQEKPNTNFNAKANDCAYYIWLQLALGPASRLSLATIEHFGGAKNCYYSQDEWRVSGLFNNKIIEKLKKAKLEQALEIIAKCEKFGQKIIHIDDPKYPVRLRRLIDAPLVLYIKGTMPNVDDEVCISVVGTRSATPYGRKTAYNLCGRMAFCGALIISGAAMGIDSDSLKGALAAKGTTIGVLGCGIDYPYLINNKDLRDTISQNGAIISEYPPNTPPTAGSFPKRNRIISGLSLATVVIEASSKSGSLITADFALEQGRDVFCVPGNVMNSAYAGSNALMRDGARPVFSAYDILSEYASDFPHKLRMATANTPIVTHRADSKAVVAANEKAKVAKNPISFEDLTKKVKSIKKSTTKKAIKEETPKTSPQNLEKPIPPENLSENARKIFGKLDINPISLDIILAKTNIAVHVAMPAITELEMHQLIAIHPGNKVAVNPKED